RNELAARRDQAQQQFIHFAGVVVQAEYRLVHELQGVVLDRRLDITRPGGTVRIGRELGLVAVMHLVPVAAPRFCQRAGGRRLRERHFRGRLRRVEHGDADADGDGKALLAGGELKLLHDVVDRARDFHRAVAIHAADQRDEFVAFETREQVIVADARAQQAGDLDEQPIAGRVSDDIVHGAKAVEVDTQHRAGFAVALDVAALQRQLALEVALVHQARERVALGAAQGIRALLERGNRHVERFADRRDLPVSAAFAHIDVDVAARQPRERLLQLRERRHRPPYLAPAEHHRDAEHERERQAAADQAAFELRLLRAGVEDKIEKTDDFHRLPRRPVGKIEQCVRREHAYLHRRGHAHARAVELGQLIGAVARLRRRRGKRFRRQREPRLAGARGIFAEHTAAGSVVIAYIDDLGNVLKAGAQGAHRRLGPARGIDRRAELIELGEPLHGLLARAVLDQASAAPPKTGNRSDIDTQAGHDERGEQASDQAAIAAARRAGGEEFSATPTMLLRRQSIDTGAEPAVHPFAEIRRHRSPLASAGERRAPAVWPLRYLCWRAPAATEPRPARR